MDLVTVIKIGFAGIFGLAGTLFLTIGIKEGKQSYHLMKNGQVALGTVVEYYRNPKRGSLATAPVILFKTESGEVIRHYSTLFTTTPAYWVGQQVNIYYASTDPRIATLDGKDSWLLPVIFGIFGLGLTAITYPILIGALFNWLKTKYF